MTNQEAIRILNCVLEEWVMDDDVSIPREEALRFAINALSAIDNIRHEIKEEKEFAYADFERYKVECLGIDWEDAYDSLPDDDFRYGMERCLEIIDKHIGEVSE